MPYEQPFPTSTILLLEADPSLRRLMALGLQHDGVHVVEACSVKALPTVTAQPFDLLVLDIDRGVKSDWSLLEKIQSNTHLASLPMVVLTWDRSSVDGTPPDTMSSPSTTWTSTVASTYPQIVYLDKPFDARALYHTVQQLLAFRAAQKAAVEALAEARVLAAYSEHATPSIWPMVTAAGLLLAVVGILLHVAIAIIGVLIVVVSLLFWTLGTKPEVAPVVAGIGN